MIWLNPWAWIGLVAVGVPIAIHLLTRAQPRPQPFPTLRFLGRATTTAVRRRVLRDRALLAVRVAVVAAIVAAVAQPSFRAPAGLAGASALRRAVVIDTSDRFGEISPNGRAVIDVVRELAGRLEPRAATSVSIEVDHLPEGLARATTWLLARGGRLEIVVVSEFRRGALAQSDVSGVPADIGVRLVKIDTAPRLQGVGPGERVGNRVWMPSVTLEPDRTVVAWRASSISAASTEPPADVRILAGPAEGTKVAAAVAAAGIIGAPALPDPEPHAIAVVLPGATDRAQVLSAAAAIDHLWMFRMVERLRHDSTLAEAAAGTAADRSVPARTPPLAIIARDRSGSPLLEAGRIPGSKDASAPTLSTLLGVPNLLLVAHSDDSLFVSALLASISRTDVAAGSALDPVTLTPEELASWQRPTPLTPTPGTTTGPSREDSDGRWFWIAALALLALESWMRRTRRAASPSEVTHARVA